MNTPEIGQFLTHLTTERNVSASTQNQALSAILFLYRHLLHIPLDETILAAYRPQRAKSVPTVLSKDEVKRMQKFTKEEISKAPTQVYRVAYDENGKLIEKTTMNRLEYLESPSRFTKEESENNNPKK